MSVHISVDIPTLASDTITIFLSDRYFVALITLQSPHSHVASFICFPRFLIQGDSFLQGFALFVVVVDHDRPQVQPGQCNTLSLF